MAVAGSVSINESVLQRSKQIVQEHGLEFTNSISKQRAENFLQYPGETYADNFKRPSTGGFSTTRSGGQSIASLYMCSQGYPIEDIVDPTKLIEEKQAAFAHIMEVLKQPEEKALKDMGKIIYDGRKAEFAQLDELAKKIDFSDPTLQLQNRA